MATEHGGKIDILFILIVYILNYCVTNTHFFYDTLMFLCNNQLKNSELLQTVV